MLKWTIRIFGNLGNFSHFLATPTLNCRHMYGNSIPRKTESTRTKFEKRQDAPVTKPLSNKSGTLGSSPGPGTCSQTLPLALSSLSFITVRCETWRISNYNPFLEE
jgi:hypothetical protein